MAFNLLQAGVHQPGAYNLNGGFGHLFTAAGPETHYDPTDCSRAPKPPYRAGTVRPEPSTLPLLAAFHTSHPPSVAVLNVELFPA